MRSGEATEAIGRGSRCVWMRRRMHSHEVANALCAHILYTLHLKGTVAMQAMNFMEDGHSWLDNTAHR